MTFTANQLTSITVLGRDGSVKGILDGNVVLAGGDGMLIDVDGNELTLNAGASYGSDDDRFQRKLRVVLEGGTFIDDDGTVMEFSGMPYYVAAVGGAKGNYLNNFDFLSNPCGQVGIFTPVDPETLSSSSSSGSDSSQSDSESDSSGLVVHDPFTHILDDDGRLPLLDICQACIDCEDYALVVTLMRRVEEYQDFAVERNLEGSGEGKLSLFRQYQATLLFWNYLVNQKCFPLETLRGNKIYFVVKSGYMNLGDGPFTVTQTYNFIFEWYTTTGEVEFSITNTVARPVSLDDPSISVSKVSDTEYDVTVTYPELQYKQMILYEMVVRASETLYTAELEVVWDDSHADEPIIKTRDRLV